MKLLSYLTLTAALALCACDSKQEQARKESIEGHADTLEAQAKEAQKAGEANAEATKRDAEARAEALKKEADRTRDQK